MRVHDDLTYQEYKEGVMSSFCLLDDKGYETAEDITNYMTDEDGELFVGTSLALWIISIGAYEVEHDLLEDRVLEQLSYHIPRYEMGKYDDVTAEEKELLEKDIAFIKSKVKLIKLKSYEVDEK